MTKELTQTESWLSEYLILEKRVDALYQQAQRPALKEMFLKLGPKGDKNMAVDTEATRVSGGRACVPFNVCLDEIQAKLKEMAEDIRAKIQSCLAQQADIQAVVDRAGLTHEEYLYIEQRYFIGMSVKEMERDGCKHNRLANIKRVALEKICDARVRKAG